MAIMNNKQETMTVGMIQTGDLLAWRKDSHSTWSDFLIYAIRFLTRSKYGHVGIAWRCHDGLDDELFVIEATMPKVRVSRVTADRNFDCVPMKMTWTFEGKRFLMERLGCPYSTMDAIRAFLGLRLKRDNAYQCCELSHEYYRLNGVDLKNAFKPGVLVAHAEQYSGEKAKRVVPNRQPSTLRRVI